jgi:hypothetical protein
MLYTTPSDCLLVCADHVARDDAELPTDDVAVFERRDIECCVC